MSEKPSTQPTLSRQPYRGTRDFFPEEMRKLRYVFSVWRKVAESYGYQEYLSPLLESWDLYAAKNVSGEEIVNSQLYWFSDRGDRKVAIRPEMTPSVARMIAQKYPQLPKPIKWFSIANFMRYERPQKGRLREFFQLNIDTFGDGSVESDAEMIEIAIAMMRGFGASEKMFEIRINNRVFTEYYLVEKCKLGSDNLNEVIRVVDRIAKQPEDKTVEQLEGLGLDSGQIKSILSMPGLSLDSVRQFQGQTQGSVDLISLFELLEARGLLEFVRFDASLMRGLDYYTGNVFEQFDLTPNNNRSMFGGGRYDGLCDLFGVKDVPAVGFAPGDVTTLQFLEDWKLLPDLLSRVDVLVTVFNEDLKQNSWMAAQELRQNGIKTELFQKVGDSISNQLNYANKNSIPYVVIIGEGEVDTGMVVLRNMQEGEEDVLPLSDVVSMLRR